MLTPEQIAAIAGRGPAPAPQGAPLAPVGPTSLISSSGGAVPTEAYAPPQTYTADGKAYLRDARGVFAVPEADAARVVSEDPSVGAASQEDVAHHEYLKTLSPLAAAGKELVASTARGAGWVANTALGAANLLGAEVKPIKTEQYRAGTAALWAALNGDDMLDAYDSSIAASRDENEAFPTLMSTTRLAGDLTGMALSGGFSGVGAATRGAAAAGLGKAAQVAVGLGAEAAEGALQGGLAAYDTADAPTRERVLAAMGMGAMLSAGIGGGMRLAGKGFDVGASALAQRLPDTKLLRRVFGQPELSVEGFESLLAKGATPQEALARTLGKDVSEITEAQVKDAAQSIEQTVAERAERRSPRITADNFDRIKPEDVTDIGAAANRQAIEEGASRSIRRDMDEVLGNSFEATEQIRAMPLKRDLVEANLVADGLADNAGAFAAVKNKFQQIRERLGATVTDLGGNLEKPVKKALEDQLYVLEKAEAALGVRPKFTSGVANDVASELDQIGLKNTKFARDGMRDMSDIRGAFKGASAEEAQAIALGERAGAAGPAGSAGRKLKPVEVSLYPGEKPILSDGRHRMLAAQEAGAQKIQARVRTYDAAGNLLSEELRPVAIDATEAAAEKTVADAYIAADTLRREMYLRRASLESQANKTASARVRDQSKALFQAVDEEYHGLASTLFDESLFGKQGAVQNRVNHAWVDAIPENKIALKNFTSEVGETYGHTKYGADPDKIRSYLGSLGRDSLKNENFTRWLNSQDELMAGALEGYGKGLSPKSTKLIENTRAAIARLRGTLGKSEDLMIRSADGAAALSDSAATQGMLSSLGGSLVGGPIGGAAASALAGASLGGARGAAVGAVAGLVPGLGYANAIRLAQKTRAFAQATDSAVVDSIASFLETSTGLTKRGATLPRLAGATVPRLLPEGLSPAAAAILGRRKADPDDDEGDGAAPARPPSRQQQGEPGLPQARPRPPVAPRNEESWREAQRGRQETFTARRDFLASMTPERVMANAADALGPMASTMPNMSSALVDGYSQKISQLLQDWPKTLSNSLVPSRKSDRPSSDQIAQSEAMWTATFQPMSIFKDFKRGMVDYDAVTYLRKQWPELIQTAQMATVDLLQHIPADAPVPDNRVTQLDLFLGANGALDDTLTPSFLKTMQHMGEYAAAQESADQNKPPANQANFAEQFQTPVNRRMTA